MVLPELAGFTPIKLASQSPQGLALVDEEISLVITTLETEIETLKQNKFEVDAHIATRAFGKADRSPLLVQHHSRAHGVVTDTLAALLLDLTEFQAAVRDAQKLVGETDAASKADLTLILNQTESIDMGQYAYDQAQNNHVDTPPTDEPNVEDS